MCLGLHASPPMPPCRLSTGGKRSGTWYLRGEIQAVRYRRSPAYEPSRCELPKTCMCVWLQQEMSGVSETAACPRPLLLTIFSSPSPPRPSLLACSLDARPCMSAVVYCILYLSRYYSLRLNMFSLFLAFYVLLM